MTIRVLQAMAGAEQGGAEAFFERLVGALHRAGVQQHVLIRRNAERAARLREAGLAPIELPFGGAFDFTTKRQFAREIGKFKPHVVMTWMNRATAMCPAGDFVHVARLGGYYDLKYYRSCDHLIGNTEDIVNYLVREGWPAERAHYVPNFVEVDPQAAPMSRAAHYTPNTAPLVVAMGRLHENKAFDTLIKAMARVPNAYLWLAGDGPQRAALEQMAQVEGIKPRTRFLGWQKEVSPLLAAADLFVCPSRHEPLGNVVLEAWACGTPVVAADAQGPGMLIDHGRNGLLVPVDDVASMAQAIGWMLGNPDSAAEMAAAGRAAFEENYSSEIVIGRYRAFFDQVVAAAGIPDA
ncbi:MAG: glycosyltransferase [Rhodospirillaceae bacterium]